ncbi:thioredoxin family protein [Paenibacillus sp.]|uniref:thioredoxin family protein n=1 Tax=Paenibacillus sp. TaxID=58172 RepID=UPI002D3A2FAA|nr:thioredoxin family protein [Paenibacillus sp.]HZG57576.1 thioredoxin family protein [Paenibacillus sp.]
MAKVESVAAFDEAIRSSKPTVALFKADWCKDCVYIDPFMPDVAAKYADRLTLLVVDRDALPELGERYGVLGIPSFIAFREGKETISFISKLRKTREEIEGFFDRVLQVSEALAKAGE